jgi:hypothetical protein
MIVQHIAKIMMIAKDALSADDILNPCFLGGIRFENLIAVEYNFMY